MLVLTQSSAIFYICISGLLDYASRTLGLVETQILLVPLIATGVAVAAVLISGSLSDRFGRRPLILADSGLIALWGFPFFYLVDAGHCR